MRGSLKLPLKKYVLIIAAATLILPFALAQVPGGGSVLTPTGEKFDSNACFVCHSDSSKVDNTSPADDWVDSVHFKNGIGCERCHSASVPAGRLAAFDAFGGSYRDDHVDLILSEDIAYKSPSAFEIEGKPGEYSTVVRAGLAKQQSVAMCARCHGLTPLTPDSPKNVFPDYISSVHGQSVVVKGLGSPERVGKTEVGFEATTGLVDAAVCVDCHDPHATTSKDDPDSLTHADNQIQLCISDECHASDDVAEKYGIVNAVKTYQESHHGKALSLGDEKAAGCADCHMSEEINAHKILDKNNPNSPTYPDNRAKICAQEDCHGVELNVGSGSLHGKDKQTLVGSLINLFYRILIPAVVGFFALYIILDATLLMGKKGGQ